MISSIRRKKPIFANPKLIKMAKKTEQEETIVDVQEIYTKTELFVDKHRKTLTIAIGAMVVIVLAAVAYKNLIVNPKENDALETAWKAEQYVEIDSLDLAIEGDGLYEGLIGIIDQHKGTKAAARAHYQLGTIHRDRGEFDEAIEHFKQVDLNDDVIGPMAIGNLGDCYVENGDLSEGAKYFEKAASKAMSGKGASFVAPIYLQKAGIAHMELGNMEKAEGFFKTIVDDYPTAQQINDAKKYLAKLEAMNG